MSLNEQHAVVTGGGTGIGAAIARALAEQGARLTLMGRRLDPLEALADELPQAQAVVCDVGEQTQVHAAFTKAVDAFGAVCILVNNAGVATSAPFEKQTLAEFRRVLEVNLLGAFSCTRAVLAGMRQAKAGRIVNVASIAGLMGSPYITAYAASKHGLLGMTKCLALEVGPGITVNAVCPGYTETDMARQAIETVVSKTGLDPDKARAAIVRDNPQGRMIQPREVAETVAWLCSPGASGITGQALVIA